MSCRTSKWRIFCQQVSSFNLHGCMNAVQVCELDRGGCKHIMRSRRLPLLVLCWLIGLPEVLSLEQRGLYSYPDSHAYANIQAPFYLYAGGDFDVFWNKCTKMIFSKGVEVSFLIHLQNHPWRTYDPEKAALFVIPGLFSVAIMSHKNKMSCDMSIEDMSVTLANAVENSKWFKRYEGEDHLMVVGYFMAELFLSQSVEWGRILKKATLGLHSLTRIYIGKDFPRCIVSVGHQISSNSKAKSVANSPGDLVRLRPLNQEKLRRQKIDTLKPQKRSLFMIGQANRVAYYRNRVIAVQNLGQIGNNSFIAASKCGKDVLFKPCQINKKSDHLEVEAVSNCCMNKKLSYSSFLEQMMMSNFSLLIGGGDPGSSRFADAIAINVPQLILSDGFYGKYAPFSCIIPWHEITERIKEKDFRRNPKEATKIALRRAESRRESMIRMQQHYAADVDWTHPYSLAPNNLIVATIRRCFPRSISRNNPIVGDILKKANSVKCFKS